MLFHVEEERVQVRAMVEDRIEDHTDAALVAGVDELPQQRYVAEV